MRQGILLIILLLTLSSCTLKLVQIEINAESDENGHTDMYIDTSGASLSTETEQSTDATGKVPLSLYGGTATTE